MTTEQNAPTGVVPVERIVTQEQIGEVLTSIIVSAEKNLMALSEDELYGQWYWQWDNSCSLEWNAYKFSDMLEMHKRKCRRWEEQHNGNCCVVERVRDKYLMPRIREFVAELLTHNAELSGMQ